MRSHFVKKVRYAQLKFPDNVRYLCSLLPPYSRDRKIGIWGYYRADERPASALPPVDT
jgi:hypothetical protein